MATAPTTSDEDPPKEVDTGNSVPDSLNPSTSDPSDPINPGASDPNGPDSPDWAKSPPPDPLSLSQRRRSAQMLSPLRLGPDAPANVLSDSLEEAQVAGITVCAEFLEIRLQEDDIPTENLHEAIQQVEQLTSRATSALSKRSGSPQPTDNALNRWRAKGRVLSQLAHEFENSSERKKIRKEAELTVSHGDDVTRQGFMALLNEYFQESSTISFSSTILILFTFISDVIVLSVRREGPRLLAHFLDWAIDFIRDRVSTWVLDHGGWESIQDQSLSYVSAGAKIFLAGVCLYIAYRLAKSAVGSVKK